MKRELELIFLTDNNKKVKLSVPEPRRDVTAAEVNAVMDLILEKQVFGFSQGKAIAKVEAKIVETNVIEIAL
jgi:hypothetical protein